MYEWWQVYKGRLSADSKLNIITVYSSDERGELLAVLPLFEQKKRFGRGGTFKAMRLMGTEFESSDYLDIIALPKHKNTFIQAIFSDQQVIKLFEQNDIIEFANVHDSSALLKKKEIIANLLNTTPYSYKTKVCPYLSLPDSFDEFRNRLSRNFRSNLKRTQNKMKRSGLTIEIVSDVSEIDEAIRRLFELHQSRFRSKQADTKFNFEARGEFHTRVAKLFLKKGWLQLYQIKNKNTVIGSLYCFKFADSMMYVQGGFDPEYGKLGLGNQIIFRAIEDAIALGLKKFDFMRGNEAYKYRWTSEKIFLHTLLFPLSFKARMYVFGQDIFFKSKQFVKRILGKNR